jgi:hypothetical protein
LQRRVALKPVNESGSSLGAEVIALETVNGRRSRDGGECQRALTRKRTLWGGGALEFGDLRLLEDGSERGGALGSDHVVAETADEGRSGDGERV